MLGLLLFFSFLILIQVKHFVVDFILQTDEMVVGKGIYGNLAGINHSFQHALATFAICFVYVPDLALLLATLDFVTHYHIDYVKIRYGNRDIKTKQFWVHLGLDQLAHQLVYSFYLIAILLTALPK